eukprot:m.231362 g.231362  ORF g.231362 m.231362 type:complete len:410 (-) comp15688_c0_seq3:45-1274(-)
MVLPGLWPHDAVVQNSLGLFPPGGRFRHCLEHLLEVKVGWVRGGLRSRVRNVSLDVEPLSDAHGVVRAHPKTGRAHPHQLHRVERRRPRFRFFFLGHRQHFGLLVCGDWLEEHRPDLVLEDATAGPLQPQPPRSTSTRLEPHCNRPEFLRLEPQNLVVTIDTQTKGGCLAGAIRDHGRIEVAVLALEEPSLKSRERTPHPQVQFLACVDGERFVLIGLPQARHCSVNVSVGDGREFCPPNLALTRGWPRKDPLHNVNHLEADVLALAVAVKPEHEVRAPFRLALEVVRHASSLFLLLSRRAKEGHRRGVVPVIELCKPAEHPLQSVAARLANPMHPIPHPQKIHPHHSTTDTLLISCKEIERVDMPRDRGELELGRLAPEGPPPLVHRGGPLPAFDSSPPRDDLAQRLR